MRLTQYRLWCLLSHDETLCLHTQGMVKQLPRLVGLLEGGATGGSGEQQAQETTFGQLSPPLGSARLKAVEVRKSTTMTFVCIFS